MQALNSSKYLNHKISMEILEGPLSHGMRACDSLMIINTRILEVMGGDFELKMHINKIRDISRDINGRRETRGKQLSGTSLLDSHIAKISAATYLHCIKRVLGVKSLNETRNYKLEEYTAWVAYRKYLSIMNQNDQLMVNAIMGANRMLEVYRSFWDGALIAFKCDNCEVEFVDIGIREKSTKTKKHVCGSCSLGFTN